MKSGQGPSPTALSIIAEWEIVEDQGHLVRALSRDMMRPIAPEDGMGPESKKNAEESEGK